MPLRALEGALSRDQPQGGAGGKAGSKARAAMCPPGVLTVEHPWLFCLQVGHLLVLCWNKGHGSSREAVHAMALEVTGPDTPAPWSLGGALLAQPSSRVGIWRPGLVRKTLPADLTLPGIFFTSSCLPKNQNFLL